MARVWTHGAWKVRPGREEDFIAAWTELVPLGRSLGSGDPFLLRDRDHPTTFHSFGSWRDVQTVERFRAELGPRIRELDGILESFEAFTLDGVYPGD